MLEGYSPMTQALLGTLFTWGLTAAGAALVFIFSSRQVQIISTNSSSHLELLERVWTLTVWNFKLDNKIVNILSRLWEVTVQKVL